MALDGAVMMDYWLWRCRTNQMDGSLHPIRQFNPKADAYEGTLIPTHE